MISLPYPPNARAPITEKADWLELAALATTDRNMSLEDLAREYRRTGEGAEAAFELAEAEGDEPDEGGGGQPLDPGGEFSLGLVEDAFNEMEDRATSIGSAYPFSVQPNYIQATADTDRTLYCFLLLLRWFGIRAIPARKRVAALFERLSLAAARAYFGGADAEYYRFGEPRKPDAPEHFKQALLDLSGRLGEPFKLIEGSPYHHSGDRGLDLIVWRSFRDKRPGKLVGFGQCATGADWETKTRDLNVDSFFKVWASPPPAVTPVRMFFVPFRVESQHWVRHSADAGVLFDRCRIASFADSIPERLLDECRLWSLDVLQELRQP